MSGRFFRWLAAACAAAAMMLPATASATVDSLPAEVRQNLTAITEYQFKRLGVWHGLDECHRACLRLWRKERQLSVALDASQEVWRQLYSLGYRIETFKGFQAAYSSPWGPFVPSGQDPELNVFGQRAVWLTMPTLNASGAGVYLDDINQTFFGYSINTHLGNSYGAALRSPTLAWTANPVLWSELGICTEAEGPLAPPGPRFQEVDQTSVCEYIDSESQFHETQVKLDGWYEPLTFGGPPEKTPSPLPPGSHGLEIFSPNFDTVRQKLVDQLANHGADYEELIDWMDLALGGHGGYAPPAEAFAGGTNPAAPNLVHTCAGDPVDCATGNFTETFTDTNVGGSGITLTQSRSYNAQLAVNSTAAGPFGHGWTATFRDHLDVPASLDDDLVVHFANGSQARFAGDVEDGVYEYTPDQYVQATLTRSAGIFTLTTPDQTVYRFDTSGKLLSEADNNGNTTTLSYVGGRLDQVTDWSGRHLDYTYNSDGTVASVTDPLGHEVTYNYDGGDLVSVTDVGGKTTAFAYDSQHRLTAVTDPRGHTVTNAYDSSDRVTSQIDALGHETTWDYAPGHTTITDPSGKVTEELFENHLPIEVVRAVGTSAEATTELKYDDDYNMVEETDPKGHVWKSKYDKRGNRIEETDPLGHTTSYTYNSRHDVEAIYTPRGEHTFYEYDSRGNLRLAKYRISDVVDGQTEFVRDTRGQITDAYNYGSGTRHWQYTYDSHGNQVTATTPLNRTTTSTYDANGQVLTVTTPRGKTSTTVRDAYGAPLTVTDARGKDTTYEYDSAHNLVGTTDPEGHHATTTYDALDRPTEQHRADGSVLTTAYTTTGQVASQGDGLDHETTYTYDAQHRLKTIADPLNRTTRYGYDAVGNRTSIEDPGGHEATLTYDAANRLTSIDYASSAGHDVSYVYDEDGRRTSMTDSTGTTSYTYNGRDQLLSQTTGAGQTTTYGRDYYGRVTSIQYPDALGAVTAGSGNSPAHITTGTVTRAYNDDDELTSVTDWLGHTTTFAYDDDGNLTGVHRPNGVDASYTYDDNDVLASVSDVGVSTTLGRDDDAQLTTSTAGSAADAFGYDDLHRLTSAPSRTYGYDDADRLITIGIGSATPISQHFDDASQLTSRTQGSATLATYDYDAEGRRTGVDAATGPDTTLTWSTESTLTAYDGPDATSTSGGTVSESYTYDGDGARQTKTSAGQRIHQAYDLTAALPLTIVDGPDAYITGPGGLPIEQISGDGTVRYFHHDQLGSTTALTNASGATVQSYSYDAYGQRTSATPTIHNPFQFAGQYTDVRTGLQYLRSRYYDPSTGQFLSRDPLESTTGQPYSYADDNPTNATDPSGLISGSDISDAAAGFGDTVTSPLEAVHLDTRSIRRHFGIDNVNYCSGAYTAGEVGAEIWKAAWPGGEGLTLARLAERAGRWGPEARTVDRALHFAQPSESGVWRSLKPGFGKYRTNGQSGKRKRFFGWDRTHGDIEVYDGRGQHLGSMDPDSGEMTKPPVPGRSIKVP
jgi:RHS repeat-associated protein